MTKDYKSTIFLPRTSFPMKANLPEKESEILQLWEKNKLYEATIEKRKNCKKFILHDGPPYANGNLHMGHALNKILKDIINRIHFMMGKQINFVPGWDCHGLPIEWEVESKYRKSGKNKDDIPVVDFRRECRNFAKKWIDVQSNQFKRMGISANWKDIYTTMDFSSEAKIVEELGLFLFNGYLYKGERPVLWSVVEKTALAEAEVEYQDHTSDTIIVSFPIIKTDKNFLKDTSLLIWTTTPWTIPGNRAVAYGSEIDYVVIKATKTNKDSLAKKNERLLVALSLLDKALAEMGISEFDKEETFRGSDLEGTICEHPLRGKGYEHDVPAVSGDFVTVEAGTGFVHIAPGHGEDDFQLGKKHNLEIPKTVGPDGKFYETVPIFSGKHVYKVDSEIIELLKDCEKLKSVGKTTHSYPHSWRSKAPLIFRITPQWFISLSKNNLRKRALDAVEKVLWFPKASKNRIKSMIEARPDWCISRQRAWGVPIPIFVNKKTNELLLDKKVFSRIVKTIEKEGVDSWFLKDPSHLLSPEYNPEDYEFEKNILDVWFDSGCTHSFVLEGRKDLKSPASLYLEGSDQHRGWFHSSLLESVGTRDQAPYQAVLTHGFVLDVKGRKMSKSLGNVISPQDIIEKYGADVLRLWVSLSDYTEDLRIGNETMQQLSDSYRRIRNTFRFLLGNLEGFEKKEKIEFSKMPKLEKWILHKIYEMNDYFLDCLKNYELYKFYNLLHNFCAVELSSFYFDIRKDALYCDSIDSVKRRSCRTVLRELLNILVSWFSPVLCFTTEEVWKNIVNDANKNFLDKSIHLCDSPKISKKWNNKDLAAEWDLLRNIRRVIMGALEIERGRKNIGSGLDACAIVYLGKKYENIFSNFDLAEIAITSSVKIGKGAIPGNAYKIDSIDGIGSQIVLAEGEKCSRCWKILNEVGSNKKHEHLCLRCIDVVEAI